MLSEDSWAHMKILKRLPDIRELESNFVYHLIFEWYTVYMLLNFCKASSVCIVRRLPQLVGLTNKNKSWYHGNVLIMVLSYILHFPVVQICRLLELNHLSIGSFMSFIKKKNKNLHAKPFTVDMSFPARLPAIPFSMRWILFFYVQTWRVPHYSSTNQKSFLRTRGALKPPWGDFFAVVMSRGSSLSYTLEEMQFFCSLLTFCSLFPLSQVSFFQSDTESWYWKR